MNKCRANKPRHEFICRDLNARADHHNIFDMMHSRETRDKMRVVGYIRHVNIGMSRELRIVVRSCQVKWSEQGTALKVRFELT